MIVVYKWGGIAFDDKNLIKTLFLPSSAKSNVPITFHDEGGSNYQVPGGKVFIAGRFCFAMSGSDALARAGESNAVDGVITKDVVVASTIAGGKAGFEDVLGVFTAGKYVTAGTNTTAYTIVQNSALYGIEIDAWET